MENPDETLRNIDIDSPELRAAIVDNVNAAITEDVGTGDLSALLIDADQPGRARVITRDDGVFCGLPWVDATGAAIDKRIEIHWQVADGEPVRATQTLFEMSGPARSMLTAERTMLNFVQLLAGTATLTARYVALCQGTDVTILDTRKTLPGLRLAQKYAVTCGGGHNHRIGLFDAFLIKENHISAAGSITLAVARARRLHATRRVEVEVETFEQLSETIEANADVAMLDNFSIDQTAEAVTEVAGRIKLEASGGVNETTITDIANTGVDYISIGNLTKEVRPLDLSMRFI